MPEKILIAINGTLNYCRLKLYLLSVLAKLRFIFEVTNKMFKIFKKSFKTPFVAGAMAFVDEIWRTVRAIL